MYKFNGESVPVDKLPQPSGWRLLVGRLKLEEKTAGGIYLPDDLKKAKENNLAIVKVLAVGDLSYRAKQFKESEHDNAPTKRWANVGDVVVVGRYAGQDIEVYAPDGSVELLKFVNDDEVAGLIPNIETIAV